MLQSGSRVLRWSDIRSLASGYAKKRRPSLAGSTDSATAPWVRRHAHIGAILTLLPPFVDSGSRQ
jgi:hypothetical protein